jgi:hypothetical protein
MPHLVCVFISFHFTFFLRVMQIRTNAGASGVGADSVDVGYRDEHVGCRCERASAGANAGVGASMPMRVGVCWCGRACQC